MSTTLLKIGTGRWNRTTDVRLSAECYDRLNYTSIGGSGGNRTHIHRAYETLALPYLRLNHNKLPFGEELLSGCFQPRRCSSVKGEFGRSGGIRTHRLSD